MEDAKKYLKDIYMKIYPEENNLDDYILTKFLLNFTPIYDVVMDKHRWYYSTFRVTEVGSRLIGYKWYSVTGDMSIADMDLELDWSTVGFVHPVDVKTTIYKYD